MIIKNVSGETRYFGFGRGTRGRTMANNGTSTVPDNDPFVYGLVQSYVAQGILQVISVPEELTLAASSNTPAYGFLQLNGAAADNDTFTVAGMAFEFENDPGSAVLGAYNANLTDAAYKWAGDGAAAATAAGTLRTAINANTATTGIVADAAVQYDTGLYLIPLRRADGNPATGSIALAKSGVNLAVSGATLAAGVTSAVVKQVSKVITVTAGDVTLASILVASGLTAITSVNVSVLAATGIVKAWNGATLISGGNVVLNNVGNSDWADTDVINVTITGN